MEEYEATMKECDLDFSLKSMLRCPICGSTMELDWEECASGDIECLFEVTCDGCHTGFQFGDVCVLRGIRKPSENRS